MSAAHDDAPWPPILTDAPYGIDIEFYGADTSSPMAFGEEATFNLVLSPAGRAKPAADLVYELTSDDGILRPADHIVSIVPSLAQVSTWSPGLYEVELRQFAAGVATAAIYTGTVLVERGLSDRAELGGGRLLEGGGAATVQVFNRVRVLRGAAGGAAGLALSYALAAQASAEAADTDAAATAADRIQTGQDRTAVYADMMSADADAAATAADRIQTGQDRAAVYADMMSADADAAATAADRIQTGQDRTATAADRVQTGQDRTATAADRVQTGLDKTATAADRVQTGLDKVATAADRVQTGLDRTQTGADKTAADGAAAAAAASAATAATAALNILERVAIADPTATLAQNTGNVIRGVENLAARPSGQTYFRVGLVSSTALTSVGTLTRATARLVRAQSGAWSEVGAGVPAVTTAGLDVWEGTTNKWPGWNASPQTLITPTTLAAFNAISSPAMAIRASGGDANTLFGVVDDTTALRAAGFGPLIDAGRMNGRVYKIDNSASAAVANFIFDGTSGNTNNHVVSVYRRGGTGHLGHTGNAFISAYPASTDYARAATAAFTPDVARSGSAQVGAGQVVWFILYQLEEKTYATPPVIVAGATATRNTEVPAETVNVPAGQAFTINFKGITPAPSGVLRFPFALSDGTNNNFVRAFFNTSTNDLTLQARSGGGTIVAAPTVTLTEGAPFALAVSVSGTALTYSFNGAAPATITLPSAALPALTALKIGCDAGGASQLNSTIRELSIKMRASSNAELQALSDFTLTHDADFTAQTYRYVSEVCPAFTDLPITTFSRSTTGSALNVAGAVLTFAAGAMRVTDAGLTVEPAATNLLLDSGDQTAATWTLINGSVARNATAPDGTANAATTFTEAATTTAHGVLNAGGNRPISPGGLVSASIFIGAGSRRYVTVSIENGGGGVYATLDTLTGAMSAPVTWLGSWSAPAASAVPVAGGYRVTISGTNAYVGSTVLIIYGSTTASAVRSESYLGNGSTIIVWGAQIEFGASSTAYIPTTTVAVTRNRDVLTSVEPIISPTIVCEFTVPLTPAPSPYPQVFSWDDGTSSNRVMLQLERSTMALTLVVTTGGVQVAGVALGTVVAGTTYKVAARLATNDVAASKSGAAVVTDTSVALPTVTAFRYGQAVSSSDWGPGLRKIKRYSVAKTNAELQALAA